MGLNPRASPMFLRILVHEFSSALIRIVEFGHKPSTEFQNEACLTMNEDICPNISCVNFSLTNDPSGRAGIVTLTLHHFSFGDSKDQNTAPPR